MKPQQCVEKVNRRKLQNSTGTANNGICRYLLMQPWYKRSEFAGNAGYTLAFIGQLVFSGTRQKLHPCPLKVD